MSTKPTKDCALISFTIPLTFHFFLVVHLRILSGDENQSRSSASAPRYNVGDSSITDLGPAQSYVTAGSIPVVPNTSNGLTQNPLTRGFSQPCPQLMPPCYLARRAIVPLFL